MTEIKQLLEGDVYLALLRLRNLTGRLSFAAFAMDLMVAWRTTANCCCGCPLGFFPQRPLIVYADASADGGLGAVLACVGLASFPHLSFLYVAGGPMKVQRVLA